MPAGIVRNLVKRRSPVVVIDLSERNTRAAVLQWEGESCSVRDYAFLEAPGLLATLSRGQLAEHLKSVLGSLAVKSREAVILLGMHDAQVRTLELPNSADTNFRTLLKLNTTKYFNQEPAELAVDCVPLPASGPTRSVSKEAQVLGVALNEALLRLVLAAAKDARLQVVRITPTQVGLANAVRLSRREAVDEQVMAIVDFGPKTCAVTALIKGQPAFCRVIDLDDSLSAGLDEAFATPYPVAAEIRTNLIRTRLQKLLFPVGRDISAAIDFFEAQANCRIGGVLFTGGTERAELIADTLQAQLDVPCQRIDVAGFVRSTVPLAKAERASRDLPRLVGSVGAAAATYVGDLVQINLLAERLELAEQRKRDPVRRCGLAAAAGIILLGAWTGYTHYALRQTARELQRLETETKAEQAVATAAAKVVVEGKKSLATAAALQQHATNRFLFAPALNALQDITIDEIQVVQMSIQQHLRYVPPVKANNSRNARVPAKKGHVIEAVSLSIQAKNFGDTKGSDAFMDQIAGQPYFQSSLRPVNAVTLKSRNPRQVDPLDPSVSYTLFAIECLFPERILGYE